MAAALMTAGFVAPSFAAAPAPAPKPPIVLVLDGIEGESKQDTTPIAPPICITVLGATICLSK